MLLQERHHTWLTRLQALWGVRVHLETFRVSRSPYAHSGGTIAALSDTWARPDRFRIEHIPGQLPSQPHFPVDPGTFPARLVDSHPPPRLARILISLTLGPPPPDSCSQCNRFAR